MNPTTVTIDPDDVPNGYPEPEVTRDMWLNPQPDLTDSKVLVNKLKESAAGMQLESYAADSRHHQSGHANPSFMFGQVTQHLTAAATKVEQLEARIAELTASTAAKTTPPSEPAAKPGKK